MARRGDFERVWVPRIGKEAADAQFFFRQLVTFGGPAAVVFVAAAGALIGRGSVGTIVGVVCLGVTVVYFALFVLVQVIIVRALSRWFGIRVWDTPKTPKRFDAWVAARSLKSPDERLAVPRADGVD